MLVALWVPPLVGGSVTSSAGMSSPISLCTDVPWVGNCSLSSVDNPPCELGSVSNLSTCDCLVVNSAPGGLAEHAIDRWNTWERTQAWIQLIASLTSLALSLSFMLTIAVWPGRMLRYVRQPTPGAHRACVSLTNCRALAAAHPRLLELLLRSLRLAAVCHRRNRAPQMCVPRHPASHRPLPRTDMWLSPELGGP